MKVPGVAPVVAGPVVAVAGTFETRMDCSASDKGSQPWQIKSWQKCLKACLWVYKSNIFIYLLVMEIIYF